MDVLVAQTIATRIPHGIVPVGFQCGPGVSTDHLLSEWGATYLRSALSPVHAPREPGWTAVRLDVLVQLEDVGRVVALHEVSQPRAGDRPVGLVDPRVALVAPRARTISAGRRSLLMQTLRACS